MRLSGQVCCWCRRPLPPPYPGKERACEQCGGEDHFTFTDHALDLEFSDRGRLIEFFQKSRELFPDTVVEADAISECRDQAVVQWKLKATQEVSYGGYFHRRVPISLRGVSIVHMKNGRVTRWSDYYDQLASRRSGLAAFFTEWIEY